MVSAVIRSTILPLVTPDAVRGPRDAVEMFFTSASNRVDTTRAGEENRGRQNARSGL
jgi:hypothetical protein